ncbi:hypothetical protein A3H80_04965 [Candidatus Roizmanbacteria bacterium RIFCSPLOWO2_02_FULL_37_19]|uniref:Peptidase M16 n=1 Tax=Candidatus Roizmanbacteria bacterium RIFCSPHIGHO2_02_FULL_37_24 TaxID=1802037 RepID=A0A1F7GYY8_9BACT|nr:MAG: hypothetical protein A2862_04410 [Candidatus Roizmanbacteria bacterium RIFCSPHIGHO2_01_FULL_38_41]OGK24161.1 MAG: hypothetical protein A3C24_02720 [Candidatus Roizmanbacteria bacterium RIFCSPHIGHO2_02_FULL_37_24]OGK32052.1 MAG: hypothetical protein A3E10_04920 [Candidatus Roizmanbacteria bacterium RIFCSPHIGHO2_12_FULL_37_23]OGK55073.1 MAG: hypothetical protein A3H80_04965 [Candidatus Roizmanbacteria bacterium RIFCSPLOWO2_02_FULL_37_19]OGK59850.1 MAG: hypothetical protein A3G65_01060 [Ca
MKTDIHTLENGLQVILVDTEAFPSATILLLMGAGSRYETRTNNGIAHFFEHMAFKGSKKYPNSFMLSSIIDGIGGEFNAFTAKDYTGYYVKAPTKYFDTVVSVIADMVQYPLLKESEIAREKGVIIQEINMYEDTPQRQVFRLYENLLYPNSPLGMDVIGSSKTVSQCKRRNFLDYIADLYYPNNAVLIVAGGLSNNIKDYLQRIEDKFGSWKKGNSRDFEKVSETQNKPHTLLRYKKSEQAHLCIGYRTFSRFDQRRYALGVLSAILGKGMSSRLFREVREKRGLAYSIGTYNEHYHEVGNMLTYAGVSTDENIVQQTIEVIQKEYNKIKKNGPHDEELKRAKELLKGRLVLSMEDTYNVASFYGRQLLLEKEMRSLDAIISKIDAVKKDDVINVAQEVFDDKNLNLAVVGPFKNDKTLLR